MRPRRNNLIKPEQLISNCARFQKAEKPTYRLVRGYLGGSPDAAMLADGIAVFLAEWNRAFYRGEWPRHQAIKRFLERSSPDWKRFRNRNIRTFSKKDEAKAKRLFRGLMWASRLRKGKRSGEQSPVGAAKALFLMAPQFFPPWDGRIARGYGCHFKTRNPRDASEKYMKFMREIQKVCRHVLLSRSEQSLCRACTLDGKVRPLVKLIDESNYYRFSA